MSIGRSNPTFTWRTVAISLTRWQHKLTERDKFRVWTNQTKVSLLEIDVGECSNNAASLPLPFLELLVLGVGHPVVGHL